MAPSLIDKVNTLVNANLHSIVDRALQQNSVAVMDEYIRQAEKNLEALEDSAATVGGTVQNPEAQIRGIFRRCRKAGSRHRHAGPQGQERPRRRQPRRN